MSELIPFGKYKGQPIEVMALDHAYMDWVRQQSWFADKYPSINTLIINNFTEPSETPEHNAMQATFFKKEMQIALINILTPPDTFNLSDKVFRNYVDYQLKTIVLPAIFLREDVKVNVEAEYLGFDIYLTAHAVLNHIDQGIEYGCRFDRSCAIELKPCLGDDYPAVLRQIKANKARVSVKCILIVGSYEGKGADWNTVTEIFTASQLDAFLISDIGGV